MATTISEPISALPPGGPRDVVRAARLRSSLRATAIVAALLAAYSVFAIADGGLELYLQRVFDGVSNGVLYGAVALALVLVFKATRVINFAQGSLAMFGTFLAYMAYDSWGVPLALAIVAAMIVSAARRGRHRARGDPPVRRRQPPGDRDRDARPLPRRQRARGLHLGLRPARLPEPLPARQRRLRRDRRRAPHLRGARHDRARRAGGARRPPAAVAHEARPGDALRRQLGRVLAPARHRHRPLDPDQLGARGRRRHARRLPRRLDHLPRSRLHGQDPRLRLRGGCAGRARLDLGLARRRHPRRPRDRAGDRLHRLPRLPVRARLRLHRDHRRAPVQAGRAVRPPLPGARLDGPLHASSRAAASTARCGSAAPPQPRSC